MKSLLNDLQSQLLDNVQIVMVNTTLPANIGSAARAMHTMGLSYLTVVAPKLPIDDTSVAHAAGAQEILANTRIVASLDEALAESNLVFAASSRSRSMPRPVVTPTQAAQIMTNFLQNSQQKNSQTESQQISHQSTSEQTENGAIKDTIKKNKISILFGREDRGLTNEELGLAAYHIQIDANPAYPVLNVASAVQVIASFIYAHVCQLVAEKTNAELVSAQDITEGSVSIVHKKSTAQMEHIIRQEWDEPAITHAETQLLNQRLTQMMIALKLAEEDDLRLLPQRLGRMTARMQFDKKEYQLINAVMGKLSKFYQ